MAWVKVLKVADLPVQGGRRVMVGACSLAIFRLSDGSIRAVSNQCPHRQGSLADGIVSGSFVYCPLHDWKLSLDTGCAQAPDRGEIETFAVAVRGEDVLVEFDELAQSMCQDPKVLDRASVSAQN